MFSPMQLFLNIAPRSNNRRTWTSSQMPAYLQLVEVKCFRILELFCWRLRRLTLFKAFKAAVHLKLPIPEKNK